MYRRGNNADTVLSKAESSQKRESECRMFDFYSLGFDFVSRIFER